MTDQRCYDSTYERGSKLGARGTGTVPCNGCRVCCRKVVVALFPDRGDVVANYETTQLTLENGSTLDIHAQNPNGDCVNLGDQGCTIYGRAPAICRAFDCSANTS